MRPGLAAHQVGPPRALWARHNDELLALVHHDLDRRRRVEVQAVAKDVDDANLHPLRPRHSHRPVRVVHTDDERTASRVVERTDQHGQVRRGGQLALELQRFAFGLSKQIGEGGRIHRIHPTVMVLCEG